MENVVIVGASGHGGMVLDCIRKQGQYEVVGFIDSFKLKGTEHCGLRVLGTETELPCIANNHNISGAIIAIGNNWTRKTMAERIFDTAPRLRMITVIHPSATIASDAKIGMGTIISPGAIVNANSQIGEFCILNTKASLGHDGQMADFSSIASGVCSGGNLFLNRYAAISLGANIIENITIGAHSLVGAGSLVVRDVPPYSVVYGSPARFIRERAIGESYLSGDRITERARTLAV